MDKLPFPTPNDPLHSARMAALKEAGHDDFNDYMAPLMTLSLKQGFGRLIRRATDRGVVAILDERLTSKGYGGRARQDLPPARYSRDFKDVHRFFQTALESQAEFALNVWAKPVRTISVLEDIDEASHRWRWQLLRLQDGRTDSDEGVLAGVSLAEVELHALVQGLANLRRRVEAAGRPPGQYVVEVRCSPETAELAASGGSAEWPAARSLWHSVHLVPLVRVGA
jgi:ATP-dependent DNA helicase DinG